MEYRKISAGMALVITLSLSAAAVTFKKYEVRSGKVSYTIRGSGNVMGAAQELAGKKRLIFDQYGFRELEEEATVEKVNVLGQMHKEKRHTLVFRNGTKVKIADFRRRTITETEPPGMAMMIAAAKQNLTQMGEEFLKKMGGRKVGTDTVAGYRCDVWKLPIVTQCIYKGVPLRIESDVMGMHQVTIATKAKFDVPVTQSDYKLPDFPVRQLPAYPGTPQGTLSVEEMGRMMGALQRGMKSPHTASPLALMKQEALAQLPAYKSLRKCLEKSENLSEANGCERVFSERIGTPSQPIDHWDDAIKKSALQEIDEALDAFKCMQKAKSMEALQRCAP